MADSIRCATAQVETLLKTQDPNDPLPSSTAMFLDANLPSRTSQPGLDANQNNTNDFSLGGMNVMPDLFDPQPMFDATATASSALDPLPLNGGLEGAEPITWEMISLGIDEPLPTQDVIDEL